MWFSLFLLIFYFFVPAPFISSVPVASGPSYHKGCTWSCILRLFFFHSYSCSLLYNLQIDPFLFKECLHIKCALSTIFPSLQCLQSTKESRADVSWGDPCRVNDGLCLFLAMSKYGHKVSQTQLVMLPLSSAWLSSAQTLSCHFQLHS